MSILDWLHRRRRLTVLLGLEHHSRNKSLAKPTVMSPSDASTAYTHMQVTATQTSQQHQQSNA